MTDAIDRRDRWIQHWEPEDEEFWEREGRRIARKNLVLSMFTEHLGFAIWVIWTVVVLNLGDIGINLSVSEQFLLTLVPNLIGSALRIPYTFAIPRFGGRRWTVVSAALLLVPAGLLAFLVPSGWLAHQTHELQLWVLLGCAATAGVGGGNFSSSMANISYFYPERKKGFALGLNAAGGNLGVAAAQLMVPLAVIIGVPASEAKLPVHQVHLAYAGLMWLPLIAIAIALGWRYMDSLTQARSDSAGYVAALRHRQTWIISALYVGTFGSFIGFSFAMPLVIKNTFPEFLAAHPFVSVYLGGLGFVGALVGSLSRPVGGWMADRVGGAVLTFWVFAGLAAATGGAILGVQRRSFGIFFVAYLVLFVLAGVGNGSTYKMIPAVFSTEADGRRRAAAVIGIAGAIGAFGGVLIQVALRQASLHVSQLVKTAPTTSAKVAMASAHANWSVPALVAFLVAYVVLGAVTWAVYLLPRGAAASDPASSLARASL